MTPNIETLAPPPTRRAVIAGAAGVGIALAGAMAFARKEGKEAPNLVLIMSDEHNAKLMGCTGRSTILTPAMDGLAAQGARLNRCYAASPICAPARQSLLTGLYPPEHGQLGNQFVFSKEGRTVFHHLHEMGYRTAAFGKLHANDPDNDLGFQERASEGENQEYHALCGRLRRGEYLTDEADIAENKLFRRMGDPHLWAAPLPEGEEHPDARTLRDALDYLHKHRRQRFAMVCSFILPHHPWVVPSEYYHRFDPETIDVPKVLRNDLDDSPWALQRYFKEGFWDMGPRAHRLCRARYYGAVAYVDSLVGQVLARIDALGLAENTLVIYCSDHGDMVGEKGLWRKTLMFDGAEQIPAIVRLPGVIPAGVVREQLINQVDLMQSAVGLMGLEPMADVSGQDLSACLREDAPGPTFTYSVEGASPNGGAPHMLMVRSDRYKYVRYNEDFGTGQMVAELYDMAEDPDEVNNLAGMPAGMQAELDHAAEADRFFAALRPCPWPIERYEGTEKED